MARLRCTARLWTGEVREPACQGQAAPFPHPSPEGRTWPGSGCSCSQGPTCLQGERTVTPCPPLGPTCSGTTVPSRKLPVLLSGGASCPAGPLPGPSRDPVWREGHCCPISTGREAKVGCGCRLCSASAQEPGLTALLPKATLLAGWWAHFKAGGPRNSRWWGLRATSLCLEESPGICDLGGMQKYHLPL